MRLLLFPVSGSSPTWQQLGEARPLVTSLAGCNGGGSCKGWGPCPLPAPLSSPLALDATRLVGFLVSLSLLHFATRSLLKKAMVLATSRRRESLAQACRLHEEAAPPEKVEEIRIILQFINFQTGDRVLFWHYLNFVKRRIWHLNWGPPTEVPDRSKN